MTWNSGAKCLRVDEVSADLTYFGYAIPGTLDAEPKWRIVRFSKTGTETKIEYSGGSTEYSAVWNDRGSISYS
jgi:hypothetical protein